MATEQQPNISQPQPDSQNPDNSDPKAKKKLVIKVDPKGKPGTASEKTNIPPEKPFVTIVLGETGVGKTFANLKREIPIYLKDNPAIGKRGRKVLIYDVNNDYEGVKTLKATPEAIAKFVKQVTVEARRIVGKDEFGRPLDKNKNYENAHMIIQNFINGLIVLDDIDKYAVHSSKQDLVSMLMGNRHIGCHILISHQAWRKMTVTELENIRYIRVHHTRDDIDSLPEEKKVLLEHSLCKIATLIVEEQYELATDMYEQGKLDTKKYEAHKAHFVYIDVRRKKILGASENAFQRAAYKYMAMYPAVVDGEIQRMVYMGQLSGKVSALKNNMDTRTMACLSLYEKYKRYIR